MDRLLIATHNASKRDRYGRLLSKAVKEVLSLDDLGIREKPSETGGTAEENAAIKARFYAQKSGMPVFCEDEALYVDFLPEDLQPGVHVRRINRRDEVDDERLLSYWTEVLSRVPEGSRTGRWHIAYCLASTDGRLETASMDHPVTFFYPPSRTVLKGWPMSSIEAPSMFDKPESELTSEEKEIYEQKVNSVVLEMFTTMADRIQN